MKQICQRILAACVGASQSAKHGLKRGRLGLQVEPAHATAAFEGGDTRVLVAYRKAMIRSLGYGLLFAACALLLAASGGFSGNRTEPLGAEQAIATSIIAFFAGVVFSLMSSLSGKGTAGFVGRWVLAGLLGFGAWAIAGSIVFEYQTSVGDVLIILALGAGAGLGLALFFAPFSRP